MDTKLFARIGAGTLVAVALSMTALQLREERRAPVPEIGNALEPDDDPLLTTLRDCAAMGEKALERLACRAAWIAKRRHFLGVRDKVNEPTVAGSEVPLLPYAPQPSRDQ